MEQKKSSHHQLMLIVKETHPAFQSNWFAPTVSLPLGPFKAETNQGVIQNAIPVVFYSQHFLACPGLHHNTSGKNVLSS